MAEIPNHQMANVWEHNIISYFLTNPLICSESLDGLHIYGISIQKVQGLST
eukprot:Gb_39435 [translate_table: standard]